MPGSRPYILEWTLQHPLARMLPKCRYQSQVYRLGERIPPSALEDHSPMWEVAEFLLDPLGTLQARINLQRDFTLLALLANCSVNTVGGFRVQFYDIKKRYRFADRGINFANFAGQMAPLTPGQPVPASFWLREPYRFEIPDSHLLLEVQNFETVNNTVQVAFYGQVLRFNAAPGLTYPGGPFTGWDWAQSVQQHYLAQQKAIHGQGPNVHHLRALSHRKG